MKFESYGRPRVVVTGMGAVTPLGNVEQMWDALINGISGIRTISTINTDHVSVKIGGEIRDFNPVEYVSPKEIRRMARVSLLAVVAAQMARADASLTIDHLDSIGDRVSVVLGTTMGPHTLAEKLTTEFRTNGHKRPNPILFANCLPNMPAHYVSRELHGRGPLSTPSAACATGTQAIGEATELIRANRADVVFTGGSEAILIDYVIAGFSSMSALAEGYENQPDKASRPFDATRSGFVLSEGCGVLVLESLKHACKRDATIYAEVIGHAASSDAYHITAIDPDTRGMVRSMTWALEDAHISGDDIHYINAHGTSTPSNDLLETNAIKKVFGQTAYSIPVSSNKSMLGHAMAAAGSLEAIASIKTINCGLIPPTINYTYPDPDCDLDYVPNQARPKNGIKYVMSNNFGLGGQNASLILARL